MNKNGIILSTVFVCSLAAASQLEARWTGVFRTIMRTPTVKHITQKITSLPGVISRLLYGKAHLKPVVINTNNLDISENEPIVTQEAPYHSYSYNQDAELRLLKKGASSFFAEDISLAELLMLLNNGPKQGVEKLTKLLFEEGQMETQIGAGDCGDLPRFSKQFKKYEL